MSDAYFYLFENGDWEKLISRRSSHIDLSDRGSNELRVTMRGAIGEFWINGARAMSLDLSADLGAGGIEVVANVFPKDGRRGASTNFDEFRIWRFD